MVKMFNKRLSVIMPVYNVEAFLYKAVESILVQTYKNIELILIDDGSTDGSGKICDCFAKKDSRVKVISKRNQGVSIARNDGLAIATGDYVTFVDSDDWLESDSYDKMMSYLLETNADIAVMGFTVDDNKSGMSHSLIKEDKKVLRNDEALENLVKGRIYTWSIGDKIYKKNILNEMAFSPEIHNGEDLLFNWQAFQKADRVAYIPVGGYHYVQRSGSMMNSFSKKKLTVIYAFEEVLKGCNRKNRIFNDIENEYISTIIGIGIQYFCSSCASVLGFRCFEIEKIQQNIRKKWKKILVSNLCITKKIAGFLLMFPKPLDVLFIKIVGGMHRYQRRLRAYPWRCS